MEELGLEALFPSRQSRRSAGRETEAYRLENEAPSNYLIDSMEARSRSNNANRMRRGMGQDRS